MLSSLLQASSTIINFPLVNKSYSISELIDFGSQHINQVAQKGPWRILEVDNTVESISQLLFLLADEQDVLVVQPNLPENIRSSLEENLACDSSYYQSLSRVALLTSGTTGVPKIVIHDSFRLYQKCILNDSHVYSKNSINHVLCVLSLSFGHGLIGNFLSALVSCNSISVIDTSFQSILKFPEFIKSNSIQFMSSVPSFWKAINLNDPELLNDIIIGVGSSYLSYNLCSKIFYAGAKQIINFYGLTEMSNWIGLNQSIGQDPSTLYDASGNAIFSLYQDVQFEIDSDEDKSQSHGELCLKHNTMLLGYLGNRYPSTGSGYYRTSDIFEFNSSTGQLIMKGRDKFYVKRAGHRIHLTQIDSLIASMNLGLETITVNTAPSLSDEAYIVTLVESADLRVLESLQKKISKVLSSTNMPNQFLTIPIIPKTSRGKVDYNACVDFCHHD